MQRTENMPTAAIQRVIIIDDDMDFRALFKTLLTNIYPDADIQEYDPVANGKPPKNFDWSLYDLLILDYELGGGEKGLDWLRQFKKSKDFPSTIIMTAHGDEELAVQAIRLGAQDYINKQKLSLDRLKQAITNAINKHEKEDKFINTLTLQSTIFNKVSFYKKLKVALKKRNTNKHAFLLQIRIDKHHELHEEIGLLATDNYTTHVAGKIAEIINDEKYKFNTTRIGDALIACLITEHSDPNGGEEIAKKICRNKDIMSYTSDGKKVESTISIGIVTIDSSGNVDELLSHADEACLAAAKEASNSYYIYDNELGNKPKKEKSDKPAINDKSGKIKAEKPEIEINLKEAIDQNRVQAYFQPFIALSDSASMFEAEYFNLRVNVVDLDGQVIFSNKDPVNIRDDNYDLLDRWVIRQGLGQLLNSKEGNSKLKYGFFIRLSEKSLMSDALYEWMVKLIAKTKTPNIASTLVFELRPPDFLGHKKVALSFINQMRESWGVSFALYDVINPSVLEVCVKQAGFEFVAISMSQDDNNLISAITENSRNMGAITVLEDIENEAQLQSAIQMGADYAEGDFIQPPLDQLILTTQVISI